MPGHPPLPTCKWLSDSDPSNNLLSYQGLFTPATLTGALTLATECLYAAGCDLLTARRVLRVMIELIQNIRRHSRKAEQEERSCCPAFALAAIPGGYCVSSCNLVDACQVPRLRSRLEWINALDKKQLNEWYRRILLKCSIHGGGGLGFVDMARRSGEKLSFYFEETEGSSCFFILKVTLCRKGESLN